MAVIQGIYAREILDARGQPTIESTVWLDNGVIAIAKAPSGTSVGKYEALDLRDSQLPRLNGMGVKTAIDQIHTIIAPQLIGRDIFNQTEIDQTMISLDGTKNKSKLGANAIISISQACLKAATITSGYPLYRYLQQYYQLVSQPKIPTAIYTMIDGGSHGATNLDFQEFHIIPASHLDFLAGLEMAVTLYHQLESVLIAKGAVHSIGLNGGFAPNLYNNTDAFEILIETIKNSPYTYIQDLFFGVDIAASEFFQAGKYVLKDKSQPFSPKELLDYYRNMRKLYHVFSIEDPFQEDDWESWKNINSELGETSTIVADNLVAGNYQRIEKAISEKACNSLLVKINQVGTITEVIESIKLARSANWQITISGRSGETNDDFVADLAVGVGAEYTKFGSVNRGERLAKYNRLWQIHTELTTQSS